MSTPKILIIDDDPDFVEVTKVLFETRQYQVSAAYDPEEGWAKLEQEVPDALILRFDKMPILMLTSMREQTGFDFPGERIHSKFLPVDDYIEKGVEPQLLLDKVEQQLAEKGGGQ